ncbi:F0F1 ATP synthase subunit A [Candidatus Marinimicrobia bacterium]|nr:F0F1 ATP synthase subunit A [Candidatus Neomarinimicrobiota bacterium]
MVAANSSHSNQTVLEQVGPNIIHHVSNSDITHPIIQLPSFFGIDFSVTKHVLMLWLVAFIVSIVVILPIRKYLSSNGKKKSNWVTLIEYIVEFVKDTIAAPNVGPNWVMTWTPLFLTFFFFILFANGIGMVPIFDTIGLLDRFLLKTDSHSTINNLLHGGVTATGNFNVTAGLAAVTFFSIIIAGVKKHGFIKHWANLVPHGLAWPVYIILIPIELMGLFVKPFALTMRLAANMTGGHIAILALLSLMAIIGEMFSAAAGIGVAFVSIPMAAAISGLEIIVVLVQAYVFTLLSAVFVGMAINVHH